MSEAADPTVPAADTTATQGAAAGDPTWFCDQCGARYYGPGVCQNAHPPAELKSLEPSAEAIGDEQNDAADTPGFPVGALPPFGGTSDAAPLTPLDTSVDPSAPSNAGDTTDPAPADPALADPAAPAPATDPAPADTPAADPPVDVQAQARTTIGSALGDAKSMIDRALEALTSL